MQFSIRQERPVDYRAAEELVREAFWDVYRPGCAEHFIVHRLRSDSSCLPELNFIAADEHGSLLGCIYYSRVGIEHSGGIFPLISFGPLAVAPAFQKQGIGAALIQRTLDLARQRGHAAVGIYGDPAYYARFGFEPAEKFGVTDSQGSFCPALLLLELHSGSLSRSAGKLLDNPVFFADSKSLACFDAAFPPRVKHSLPTQIFRE